METATKACTFEGCDRKLVARGLCGGHYSQLRAGRELAPIHVRPECAFSGCAELVHAKGYCHGHYRQALRGEAMRPLGPKSLAPVDAVTGTKVCATCEQAKPFSNFRKTNQNASGLSRHCIECLNVRSKASVYGLPVDVIARLMDQAECSACGVELTAESRRLDHDHSCCPGRRSCGKCFRGVLCAGCNLALGHAGDSVERLEKLAAYLRR